METINEFIKTALHIICIFGWFWLSSWTIVRVGMFKRRVFSLLIFVYFTQGVTMTSELIVSDFDLSCSLWGYGISNLLMILGFFCLSNRNIFYKNQLNHEKNLYHPDSN